MGYWLSVFTWQLFGRRHYEPFHHPISTSLLHWWNKFVSFTVLIFILFGFEECDHFEIILLAPLTLPSYFSLVTLLWNWTSMILVAYSSLQKFQGVTSWCSFNKCTYLSIYYTRTHIHIHKFWRYRLPISIFHLDELSFIMDLFYHFYRTINLIHRIVLEILLFIYKILCHPSPSINPSKDKMSEMFEVNSSIYLYFQDVDISALLALSGGPEVSMGTSLLYGS